MWDLRELSISRQTESCDVAVSTGIDDIDKVTVLSHGNGFAAATRHHVGKLQLGAVNSKRGYFSAASVHRQQKRVVGGKRERALRCQWIGCPTTAPTSGCKPMLVG